MGAPWRLRFYHWARCSDCRRAWEDIGGAAGERRDIFAEPLTEAELEDLAAAAGGAREIFSWRSPSFKKLALEPESLAEADLIRLMRGEPRLVRRPLLLRDGRVAAGRAAVVRAARA